MERTDRRFPHVLAGGGQTYNIIGELVTFKVTTGESGGAYLAGELTSPPGGGPPLHTHPSAETFLILEGAFEFSGLDQGELYVIRAARGDTVHIPGGVPHTYKTVSTTPGRAFAVLSPGDEMERFFSQAGVAVSGAGVPVAPEGPPSDAQIAQLLAVAGQQGISFLPPQEAVASGAAARGTEHGRSLR